LARAYFCKCFTFVTVITKKSATCYREYFASINTFSVLHVAKTCSNDHCTECCFLSPTGYQGCQLSECQLRVIIIPFSLPASSTPTSLLSFPISSSAQWSGNHLRGHIAPEPFKGRSLGSTCFSVDAPDAAPWQDRSKCSSGASNCGTRGRCPLQKTSRLPRSRQIGLIMRYCVCIAGQFEITNAIFR